MDTSKVYVPCPRCGKLSNSLKCYTLVDFCLFLLLGASYSTKKEICCPSCMRKRILLKHFTYNIITANLLWLILLMPWGIIRLLTTLTKGHSSTVSKIIEENIQNNPAPSADADTPSEPPVYPKF